ncbi:S-layer homology domain-containing protein, partial [bacterium]|nr:S-layer homology domain-containing protein [bacterium]
MKKFQKILVVTMAVMLMNFAHALEIVDVKANYWAGAEIIHAIQNGYINVIGGNQFKPENSMTRTEFVTALLKVISRQDEPVVQKTTFKDVQSTTPHIKDITLSEQIRMAFGYPDKTFKPTRAITHNETMSMIANITKNDYKAADITRFSDYQEIPIWAERAYIKNVANGLYVNHPDEKAFTPKKNLTRAEAAVLFDKIVQNLDKFQDKYRDLYNKLSDEEIDLGANKAEFVSKNTLGVVNFAPNNVVDNFDNKKIVEAGNIILATDISEIRSRKDYVGDVYVFTAPEDVYSVEGEFLYPKGTEFYARDMKKDYSAWRSRPQASNVIFYKYSLPGGQTYDMAGVPFTKDDKVITVTNTQKAKQIQKITTK